MAVYLYDGSFEGLLSAVHFCLMNKTEPEGLYDQQAYQPQLFDKAIRLTRDVDAAEKCAALIKRRLSSKALRKVFYVYLSNDPQKDTKNYHYLRFALKQGRKVEYFLSEDAVKDVNDIYDKVSKEGHLLSGLVRFKEMKDGILYSQIAPDHLVLPLLAAYFSKRMSVLKWMIHDVKRDKAVLYNGRYWRIIDIELARDPLFTADELFYQKLWRHYFQTIAIEERRNPRCQRQHMPKRYWPYLVEMDS